MPKPERTLNQILQPNPLVGDERLQSLLVTVPKQYVIYDESPTPISVPYTTITTSTCTPIFVCTIKSNSVYSISILRTLGHR